MGIKIVKDAATGKVKLVQDKAEAGPMAGGPNPQQIPKHPHLMLGKGKLFMAGAELGQVSDLKITMDPIASDDNLKAALFGSQSPETPKKAVKKPKGVTPPGLAAWMANDDGVQTINTVNTYEGPIPLKTVTVGEVDEDFMLPKSGISPSMKLMKGGKMAAISMDQYWIGYHDDEIKKIDLYKNMATLTTEFLLDTHFGTKVYVGVPEHMLYASQQKKHQKLMLDDVIDYASHNNGKLDILTGSKGYSEGQRRAVLLGGPCNGEVREECGSNFKVAPSISMSMASLTDPTPEPAMTVSSYFREQIAYKDDMGLVTHAWVYRHDTVPPDRIMPMFNAVLDEFPRLRLYPHYALFWGWGVLK